MVNKLFHSLKFKTNYLIFKYLLFRITTLKEIDLAKSRKETALNNLETAIIESRDKIDQPNYSSSATEIEIKSILDKCSEVILISYFII